MANNRQLYKRSESAPREITMAEKKNRHGLELTGNIIKYALITAVLLSLIFGMLSLVTIKVEDEQLNMFKQDKFANISSFDLVSGWYAKASFNYEDRGIHVGYQYPHAFDYLVDNIPVFRENISNSLVSGGVFGAIKPEQDQMLDAAYVAMLILEIVYLIWLIGMAILFVCSFTKKLAPTSTIVNIFVIVYFVLTFVMFAFTLALATNSTPQFSFNVGIGMWLNVLVAVVMLSVVIANMVYAAKVKANENILA